MLYVVSHSPCTFPRLLPHLPSPVSSDIPFKHSSGVEASPMTSLHIVYLYSLLWVHNNSSVWEQRRWKNPQGENTPKFPAAPEPAMLSRWFLHHGYLTNGWMPLATHMEPASWWISPSILFTFLTSVALTDRGVEEVGCAGSLHGTSSEAVGEVKIKRTWWGAGICGL